MFRHADFVEFEDFVQKIKFKLLIFLSNKITSTFEMKKKLAILIVVLFLTLLVNFSNTQAHHDPNIKPEDEMLGKTRKKKNLFLFVILHEFFNT
jgi:hypothetical protein